MAFYYPDEPQPFIEQRIKKEPASLYSTTMSYIWSLVKLVAFLAFLGVIVLSFVYFFPDNEVALFLKQKVFLQEVDTELIMDKMDVVKDNLKDALIKVKDKIPLIRKTTPPPESTLEIILWSFLVCQAVFVVCILMMLVDNEKEGYTKMMYLVEATLLVALYYAVEHLNTKTTFHYVTLTVIMSLSVIVVYTIYLNIKSFSVRVKLLQAALLSAMVIVLLMLLVYTRFLFVRVYAYISTGLSSFFYSIGYGVIVVGTLSICVLLLLMGLYVTGRLKRSTAARP